MKTVLILLAALTTTNVLASGFICEALDADLDIKVYNKVMPAEGTKNPAIMVLSNPTISQGRKTIAVFKETNGLLTKNGQMYVAKVDHRFNDTGRKGELLAGTNIGNVKQVILNLDFSYAFPVDSGDYVPGTLSIVRRNGNTIHLELECERYLKN